MAWRYDEENRKQKLTYDDIYLDLRKKLRSDAMGYSVWSIIFVLLMVFDVIMLLSGEDKAPFVYYLIFALIMIITLIWVVFIVCETVKRWRAFSGIKNFYVVSDTLVAVDRHFGGVRFRTIGGSLRMRLHDTIHVIFKNHGETRANYKIMYYDKVHINGYLLDSAKYYSQLENLKNGDEFYLVIIDNQVQYYYSKRVFELKEKNS